MVLTHLILNGMIKVKGQLGEMAKCLEDPDQRISDLAKLFFTELSTKDNALYNNLQDVISHLSIGSHAVDEETFERTMRFIFTFIEKVGHPKWRLRPGFDMRSLGEASGVNRGKALSALQACQRGETMEGYLFLPVALAVQIRAIDEKAH